MVSEIQLNNEKEGVYFSNYLTDLINLKEIKDTEIRMCNTQKIFKKIKGDFIEIYNYGDGNTKKLGMHLKTPIRTINGWLSGSSPVTISKFFKIVDFWKMTCKKSEKEKNSFIEGAFRRNEYFSVAKGKKVKLPKKVNKEFAYILGYLLGDGCLKDFKKDRIKHGSSDYPISLAFDIQKFSNKTLNPFFDEVFGTKGKAYKIKNVKCEEYIVNSKVIYVFLNKLCDVPIGKKKGNLVIPHIINKSTDKIKSWFLAGLFDADGTIYIKNKEVSITQADAVFLREVKNLFSELGIETRSIYKSKKELGITYNLSLRWNSLHKFLNKIPLQHPKRIKNLIKLKQIIQ